MFLCVGVGSRASSRSLVGPPAYAPTHGYARPGSAPYRPTHDGPPSGISFVYCYMLVIQLVYNDTNYLLEYWKYSYISNICFTTYGFLIFMGLLAIVVISHQMLLKWLGRPIPCL